MRFSLSRRGISHAAVDFLSRRGISHAAVLFLSRRSISHAAGARRGSIHSCEGRFPSSRSSPPGHAAVLCCGMCYFSDGVMDSTMLDIVGCADISN